MDTGTGHIRPMNEINLKNIKGNLIQWKVGEKVECKGCSFEVFEIQPFPFNLIVLKGIPGKK